MIGIVGYGVYIPRFRLPLADIAQAWGREPQEILQGLQIQTKAVPAVDEDAVTLAVEAGRRALVNTHLSAKDVQSIFVGSESHPYTVNPSATKVAAFLGMGQSYFAADMEFACKAGTTAMQVTMGLLAADSIRYGMAIGSDTAQSRPRDVLEYTAGCGAASLVLGKKKEEVIAEILDTASYASNTPDFWRREGEKYPSHVGRFSGEPGYFCAYSCSV